jgi:hypothetical protein
VEICFALTWYQEALELVEESIKAIGCYYPHARLTLCNENKERLKLPSYRGRWTERWMRRALETGAEIIVKIDPDTRCYRRIEFPGSEVFGQIAPQVAFGIPGVIFGAAIGFSRKAILKILNSGFLLDQKYSADPYRYAKNGEVLSLQDGIVSDIVKRLGLSFAVWPGLRINCDWQGRPELEGAAFAHPVLTLSRVTDNPRRQ